MTELFLYTDICIHIHIHVYADDKKSRRSRRIGERNWINALTEEKNASGRQQKTERKAEDYTMTLEKNGFREFERYLIAR